MASCPPFPYHYKPFRLRLLSVAILSVLFHEIRTNNATVGDFGRLLQDRMYAFDSHVRPVANQSEAIDVYVTFYLTNLLEINEKEQRMSLNAWLNISWYDEIRTWDPSDYGGIDVIYPNPKEVWTPRVIVSNSVGNRDLFEDNYATRSLFANGASRWYPGTVFSVSCDLDLTYFPFDTQKCHILFIGIYYLNSVHLQFSQDKLNDGGYRENGEWFLVSHEEFDETIPFKGEILCRLRINLFFKRRPMFYVVNMLIPVMFVSFLSFFAFIIPYDSGERSSFAVTVLLSLAVYMIIVSGEIPPNSDTFPIVVNYIFSLLLLSGLSLIAVVVVHRVKNERLQAMAMKDELLSHLGPIPDGKYFGVDLMQAQSNGNKIPTNGHILHMEMPKVKGNADPVINIDSTKGGDGVCVQSQSTDISKRNKLTTKLYRVSSVAGKSLFRFLAQMDVLVFVFFTLLWSVMSVYFLNDLLSDH